MAAAAFSTPSQQAPMVAGQPGRRPVVRKPPKTTGATLTTPSQENGFTQTGAATGTSVGQTSGTIKPTTITKTNVTPGTPPPDLSGDKWMAYLTPDQRTTLLNAGTQASSDVTGQQQRQSDAQSAYSNSVNNNQYTHDINQDQVNQEMGARGMFLSSTRDNDLTDLNRTLVLNNAAALSSLNSIITDATAQINNINTQYGQTVLGAQGDAASQVPVEAAAAPAKTTTTTTPIPQPAKPLPKPPTVGKGQIGYHGGF